MRLTITPFPCNRECSYCYLKPTELNVDKFKYSLALLESTNLFDKCSLFFNKPNNITELTVATSLIKTHPISDIYIRYDDYITYYSTLFNNLDIPLAISAVPHESTAFAHLLIACTDDITIVHLLHKPKDVDDVLNQIDKAPINFKHYILFAKPYDWKDYAPVIEMITDYTMENIERIVEYDQCIALAMGIIRVSETNGIEGRIELHPDGTISFCPYFGEHISASDLTKLDLEKGTSVCNKCTYLSRKQGANNA